MSFTPTTVFAPDQFSLDSSSRVRVSQVTTLADYKELGFPRTLYFDVEGTGTYSNSGVDDNMCRLHVEPGQYIVRQSKLWHSYYAGKSQFVELTFDSFAPQAGVRKLLGYYSSSPVAPYTAEYDGFWLLSSGTTNTVSFVIRNQGNLIYSKPLSGWLGYEQLKDYNWNNFTVVAFDFLWLGGAACRMWVKGPNGFILADEYTHAGTASGIFIHSPTQPVRFEISSTTGTGDLRMICSTVGTEGSINSFGVSRSVTTNTTGTTLPIVGFKYPLLSVRGSNQGHNVEVQLLTTHAWASVQTAADQIYWTIEVNPELTEQLNFVSVSGSAIEYAQGNDTCPVSADGTIMASGVLAYGQLLDVEGQGLLDNFLAWHGMSIKNVRDVHVFTVTPLINPTTVLAGFSIKEF